MDTAVVGIPNTPGGYHDAWCKYRKVPSMCGMHSRKKISKCVVSIHISRLTQNAAVPPGFNTLSTSGHTFVQSNQWHAWASYINWNQISLPAESWQNQHRWIYEKKNWWKKQTYQRWLDRYCYPRYQILPYTLHFRVWMRTFGHSFYDYRCRLQGAIATE